MPYRGVVTICDHVTQHVGRWDWREILRSDRRGSPPHVQRGLRHDRRPSPSPVARSLPRRVCVPPFRSASPVTVRPGSRYGPSRPRSILLLRTRRPRHASVAPARSRSPVRLRREPRRGRSRGSSRRALGRGGAPVHPPVAVVRSCRSPLSWQAHAPSGSVKESGAGHQASRNRRTWVILRARDCAGNAATSSTPSTWRVGAA